MNRRELLWGAGVLAVSSSSAWAEAPISFGTAEVGTSDYAAVLAIAKSASTLAGLDIRPRPFKGNTQAIPFVDSGELDFGLSNGISLIEAFGGKGAFQGSPLENLRLAGTIYPFRVGFLVAADSPIKTAADLKGKRVVTSYKASPGITTLVKAMLSASGLDVAEVQGVGVTTSLEGVGLFENGSVDAITNSPGSPVLSQIELSRGAVRFVGFPQDPAAQDRARALIPNARIRLFDPTPGLTGLVEATALLEYDYFVYTSAKASDLAVVGVIDALVKGKDALVQMLPPFAAFDPTKIVQQIGLPYHPAAEAHYRELGLWVDG